MQFYQVILSTDDEDDNGEVLYSHVSKNGAIDFIPQHIKQRMEELGAVKVDENTWESEEAEDEIKVEVSPEGVCLTNLSGQSWWYTVEKRELHGLSDVVEKVG